MTCCHSFSLLCKILLHFLIHHHSYHHLHNHLYFHDHGHPPTQTTYIFIFYSSSFSVHLLLHLSVNQRDYYAIVRDTLNWAEWTMAQYCKELLLELLKQMVTMIFLDLPSNTHPLYPLYKTLIAKALHAHDDQTRQTHLLWKRSTPQIFLSAARQIYTNTQWLQYNLCCSKTRSNCKQIDQNSARAGI